MNKKRFIAIFVAAILSCALIGISAVSSWQRGGLEIERLLWVVLGCCLTASVHVMPSLIERKSIFARLVWFVAFIVCIFGHAQFFVLSEQHAGQERNLAADRHDDLQGRSAAVIATDISKATALMARLPVAKRDSQSKVVEALEQELVVVQQQTKSRDEKISRSEADPVGLRIAKATGLNTDLITLIVAVATAVILESIAVTLWSIGLKSVDIATRPEAVKDLATESSTDVREIEVTQTETATVIDLVIDDADIDQLAQRVLTAVQRGEIKATVVDIRDYLRCSQQKALKVRRLVAAAA